MPCLAISTGHAWTSSTLFVVQQVGGTVGSFRFKYFRSRMERLLGDQRIIPPLPILGPASESSRQSMASEGYFSIPLTSAGGSALSPILDWYPRPS
jgi:hypothetical protein